MRLEIPVVINVSNEHCFTLNPEVVKRLGERGCKWLHRLGPAPEPGHWYLPADGEDLRRDPDLVEVLRDLTSEYLERSAMMDWRTAKVLEDELTGGLRVGEVHLDISIDDYAGRESLSSRAVSYS